ncbi:MAG: hypothetical protein ACM3SO_06405 [Betaproteobacteria bacterium]
MKRTGAVPASVLLGLAVMYGTAALADEVVVVDSRPGITQSFLLLEPEGKAKGTVIMFPGEEGIVEFHERSGGSYEVTHVNGGFTAHRAARERLRNSGFAVAVIAPPSDRSVLTPEFRKSPEHLEDVRAVIDYLHKRYDSKPYLEGQCLSSLSAASVASRLKSAGISGVILTSARSSGPAGAVTDFERGAITVPVLLVQHGEDSCPHTSPRYLQNVKDFYQVSSPKVDVITVTGGKSRLKRNQLSCKDGHHSFAGVQGETAKAIASWLLDEPFPALVEGVVK